MTSAHDHLTVDRDGAVLTLTLNRPDALNALTPQMLESLASELLAAESDSALRCVVITGAGRAFAAGADAKEFDADPVEPHLPDVLNAIDRSFVPWIAASM